MRKIYFYIFIVLSVILNNNVSAQAKVNVSGAKPNVGLGVYVVVPSSIIIASASSIINNGSILAGGDFTNNGNGLDASGTGTVNFNATSTQNINGSNSITFYNITKSTTGSLVIARDETIKHDLALATASSFLNLNGNALTLNGQFTGFGSFVGSPLSALILGGAASTLSFDQTGTNNYLKTLTLNSSATATLGNLLYITASDGSNTNTYGIVTANGILTTNGNLTLRSDARGDAIVANSNGTINGAATVERYIYARRAWRFLTAPFSPSFTSQTLNAAWQENLNNTIQPTGCPTGNGPSGYGMYITNTQPPSGGFDWNTTSSPSLKIWNGTEWIAPSNTTSTSITAYPAYYTFIRGDRNICIQYGTYATPNATILRAKGQLNELAAASVSPLLGTYSSGDFVAIGNPYASPLDFTKATNYSNLDVNNFYVLDPKVGGTYGVGGYIIYNTQLPSPNKWLVVGGGAYGDYGMNSPSVIQSGQAFLMKATSDGPVSATFDQNAKSIVEFNTSGLTAGNENNDSTESNFATGKGGYDRTVFYTELLLTNDSLYGADKIAVIFGNKYQSNDSIFSAKKFWSPYNNLSIWKNGFYAISCRPVPGLTDTIFFKSYLTTGTNYTLRLFAQNVMANMPARAWLVDKYLNNKTEINLRDTTLFAFAATADTNSYRNRFMIVFNRLLETIPVPVNKIANQSDPNVTGLNNNLVLEKGSVNLYPNPALVDEKVKVQFTNMPKGNYNVCIYNLKGEKLSSSKTSLTNGNNIYPLTLNKSWGAGLYTVSVTNKDTGKTINLQLVINK